MSTTVSTKDIIVALLESQLEDIKDGAVPIDDIYSRFNGKYSLDVTNDQIKRFRRK